MIPVYFATNRNLVKPRSAPWFGDGFNELGPSFFRTGEARVDVNRGKYQLESVKIHPEDLAHADARVGRILRDGSLARVLRPRRARERLEARPPEQKLGSERLFREARACMHKEKRHALVFIHGYANDFAETLVTAGQLADKYRIHRKRPLVFVFSWPSDGSLLPWVSYYSDRADAKLSGDAMARALAKFFDYLRETGEDCGQSLHLVAHSMGAFALRSMLEPIGRMLDRYTIPALFEHALLFAADEDADALEHNAKLGHLVAFSRSIVVYHSRGDLALATSDLTKANPERLGSMGPRSLDGLSHKISAVDCRQVDDTGIADANHQYYRESDPVLADVRRVLAGETPEDIEGRTPLHSPRRYLIRGEQ